MNHSKSSIHIKLINGLRLILPRRQQQLVLHPPCIYSMQALCAHKTIKIQLQRSSLRFSFVSLPKMIKLMGASVFATSSSTVCVGLLGVAITYWVWRVLNWVWFRPKKLERFLRNQGLSGTSYRLVFGDLKEISIMSNEANSKPMNLYHDIAPRVLPFFDRTVKTLGNLLRFSC